MSVTICGSRETLLLSSITTVMITIGFPSKDMKIQSLSGAHSLHVTGNDSEWADRVIM